MKKKDKAVNTVANVLAHFGNGALVLLKPIIELEDKISDKHPDCYNQGHQEPDDYYFNEWLKKPRG